MAFADYVVWTGVAEMSAVVDDNLVLWVPVETAFLSAVLVSIGTFWSLIGL